MTGGSLGGPVLGRCVHNRLPLHCEECQTLLRAEIERDVNGDLVREILVALCQRDGLSLESSVEPGKPARNYDLALRLGIGEVFGLTSGAEPSSRCAIHVDTELETVINMSRVWAGVGGPRPVLRCPKCAADNETSS